MKRWIITLSVLLLAAAACTKPEECSVNFGCGLTQMCDNGHCIANDRGGNGDPGRHMTDGGPIQGGDIPNTETNPLIVIVQPTPYQLVKGMVRIEVTARDPENISAAGVEVRIGDYSTYQSVPMLEQAAGTWTGQFDTNQISDLAYPAIVASATDTQGSRSEVGHEFALDYRPPIIALESAQIVMMALNQDSEWECAQPFNPLGSNAVKPGQTIWSGQSFFPRIRIEDRANGAIVSQLPTGQYKPRLYLLDSVGLAAGHRLVLGNGPGTACTHINPAVIPDSLDPQPEQAIVQDAVSTDPTGMPNFNNAPPYPADCQDDCSQDPGCIESCRNADCVVQCPREAGCTQAQCPPDPDCRDNCGFRPGCVDACYPGEPPTCLSDCVCIRPREPPARPEPVCISAPSDLTLWLPYAYGARSAIYVINEYDPASPFSCTGGPFDSANFLADGPACLAVVAQDNLENKGISNPIAICIDRDPAVDECVGFDPATVQCSDGCTAPDFGTLADTESHIWLP